jgi:hypothetical protein
MLEWLSDGRRLLAIAINVAAGLVAWMFRYKPLGIGMAHRNQITGAICHVSQECWFKAGRLPQLADSSFAKFTNLSRRRPRMTLGAFARASVQRKSWANYGLLRNCSQSDHTAG